VVEKIHNSKYLKKKFAVKEKTIKKNENIFTFNNKIFNRKKKQ